MSEELGSGIYLDETLDFSIDTTGDIRAAHGLDELQKDLSTQMIFSLSEYLGQPATGNLNSKVKKTAIDVAEADERVASVDEESVDVEWLERRQSLSVDMTIEVISGEEYDLVFDV